MRRGTFQTLHMVRQVWRFQLFVWHTTLQELTWKFLNRKEFKRLLKKEDTKVESELLTEHTLLLQRLKDQLKVMELKVPERMLV